MNKEKRDELVRRLRNGGLKGSLEMQAADYIEELENRYSSAAPTCQGGAQQECEACNGAGEYEHKGSDTRCRVCGGSGVAAPVPVAVEDARDEKGGVK